MKGYKAFDKDLKCRGFQFKVGKTYTHDKTDIKLCHSGFHFCENLFDVYNYYPKETSTRICEVEALGEVKKEGDKSVTNKIKIVRELTDVERLNLWIKRNNNGNRNSGDYNSGDRNSGYYNSGDYNSGDYNSGDYNSGDYNSGDRNSGYYNSGNYNSGYYNSGYYNSGDRNSGDYNSGDYNSGNYNSGYYNSGDYNSGYFNSNTPKVRLFNKQTNYEFTDKVIERLNQLNVKPILQWIPINNMTDEEKKNNPSSATTQGYLKNTGRIDYKQLTKEDKKFLLGLQEYDDAIFKKITGISLLEDQTIEVIVNGITKTIKK